MGEPRVWTAAVVTLGVALTAIFASARDGTVLKGPAAFGDWRKDKPGVRRLLTPQDLPAPSVTPSHVNFAETTAMPAGAKPEVPPGFAVEMVASGLKAPRAIRVAPNGDLFVAETHYTRDVAVSPDGSRIYYSVGSGSNVALDMFPMPLDQPLDQFKKTHPLGAAWDTEERRADHCADGPWHIVRLEESLMRPAGGSVKT